MPTRNPSDLTDDDPTLNAMLGRMPAMLYKFSGVGGERLEWLRKLIVDSVLFFPPPSSFNDPLDCKIPPSYDAPTLVIEQFWRRVAKEHHPNQKMRDHRKAIHKLVVESRTAAGQDRLTKVFFEKLDQNGTACFAKDPLHKHTERLVAIWVCSYCAGHLVSQKHSKMLSASKVVITAVKLLPNYCLLDDTAMKA